MVPAKSRALAATDPRLTTPSREDCNREKRRQLQALLRQATTDSDTDTVTRLRALIKRNSEPTDADWDRENADG